MAKRFKVTVVEIETDVPFKNKEYQLLNAETEDGDKKYGYVYFSDVQTVETNLLVQTVDNLDISKLAIFINSKESK